MSAVPALRSLGKYRPIAVLGRGGMATVFLASSTGRAGFTKLVVVKELREDFSDDPEFREMFLAEARLAARLNHPHIVQTNEVDEVDGRLLIAMEYLDGQSFSHVRLRLKREGKLAIADVLRVLVDLLDGLHAAHELADYDGAPLNVVHRDISPHNVFVSYAGEVKLVDFGIAKAANSSSSTRTGVVKGKIRYMAPEQALGLTVDRRADVFAVGVMLWEALANRRLWANQADAAVMHALATGAVPSPNEFAADLDPALVQICDRALAVSSKDRYATAADMRTDLAAYMTATGARSDAREFGQRLADAFAAERANIRKVIEEQMRRASTLSDDAFAAESLPQLGVDSDAAPAGATPATGSRSMAPPVAPAPPHARAAPSDSTLSSPTLPPALPPPPSTVAVPARLLFMLGAVAIVVVAAAAYALWPAAPSASTSGLPSASATAAATVAPALSAIALATAPAAPSPAAPAVVASVSPALSPVAAPAKTATRPTVVAPPKAAASADAPPASAPATAAATAIAAPATGRPALDIRLSR